MSSCTSNGTQPYSPGQGDGEVSSVASHAQRPILRHSSTYDENNGDDESSASCADPLTQSDTVQLAGWKSSRRVYPQVPQSVPNKPKYKFSQQDFPGSSYNSRSFPKPLLRAGTVPDGLGVGVQMAPECTICLEEYMEDGVKAPLLLSCGHSFCMGCLETLLLKASATDPVIACPKCSNLTQVKNRDISNLRKNFDLLDAIRTISKSLSSGCSTSFEPLKNELRELSPADVKCDEHGDNLSSYCKKCGVLVCSSCLLFGSHSDHNDKTLFVGQAAKEYRKKLFELSPEVRQQKKKMEGVLVDVERMNASVQETGGRLVGEAETAYNELIGLIEAKRDALKLEIMERTQIRVEALTDQACDLQECIEKATAVYHTTEGLLQSDDYTLLQRANLTLDEIEGVFVNPPSGIPKAQNDLRCEFPAGPKEEIKSYLTGSGTVRPDVGTIKHLYVRPHHDGFRIQWDGHNFADNEGTTYYLQKAVGNDGEFTKLYRGNATKFNYKEELEHGVPYRFRVQVRTTEGVGNWSEPKEAVKAAPDFRWHDLWRNVKIDLSKDKLQAAWTKGGSHNFWATFAGDKPFQKGRQHYAEIEIRDLGKSKSPKKFKLAFGVVSCTKSRAGSLPWQDGKQPIGQWEVPSWAFQPTTGVINSRDTPPEGVKYGTDIDLQNGDYLGMLVDLDEKKVIYFVNGRELGVAFDDVDAESVLPVVSIRDKICVRLRFPPPPYNKRSVTFIKLLSRGQSIIM